MRNTPHEQATSPHATATLAALALGAALAAAACDPPSGATSGATPSTLFTEVASRAGLRFRITTGDDPEKPLVETMLGGCAWLDVDGDGDLDLYLVNGHEGSRNAYTGGQASNRLFRNDGAGRFRDVTESAGVGDRRYGNGGAVADFDNDGDDDLLVLNFGRNTLYENRGDGTFADVTASAGLGETGYSVSAAWLDHDRDGDLDLYVVRYLAYDPRFYRKCDDEGRPVYCHPRFFAGEKDLFYRNRGDGTFEEVGESVGIARADSFSGKGLGVATFDFDRDGWLDIYVANDTTPNFLWRNRGDGTFEDVAAAVGVATDPEGRSQAGMGVALGDVDRDGYIDIVVTNFAGEMQALYLGQEGGSFRDGSMAHGLAATAPPLGFGVALDDVDLDGDDDLLVLNGHVDDLVEELDSGPGARHAQRPQLFENRGERFELMTAGRAGAFFAERRVGRGLAGADLDDDGDTDFAVISLDRPFALLRNNTDRQGGWVGLDLQGTTSPHDPFGTRIEVHIGKELRSYVWGNATSYACAADPRVVVASREAKRIDRVEVFWPSGRRQVLRDVALDGSYRTCVEPQVDDASPPHHSPPISR